MTTITSYNKNPNLKLLTVTTVRGKTEYRKNCRKIRDKYYISGEDCFRIGNRWYAYNSKHIILDHEKQEYVLLKDTPLVYGIVNIKGDGTAEFGYFTENKYNNVWISVTNYGNVKALNKEILIKGDYIENVSEAVWYYKKGLSATQISKYNSIRNAKVYREKGYNIEDNKEEFTEKISSYENYPHEISVAAKRFGKMLGGRSYGAEIETAQGFLPDNIQHRTGVVICRDGSIDNAEYVTVPMRDAKGLVNLQQLSKELIRRTTIDIKCSLHFHIGGIPKDRVFPVALYALAIRIQDELYTMFPYYKTNFKGVKKQDYCQKLKKLGTEVLKKTATKEEFGKYVDEAYYRIFTWLNDGIPPDDRFNRQSNRHNRVNKWERRQRYYWLNFMNMFFSARNTAEFRLHQATVNSQKMINWLFICNAIVAYAEKHAFNILTSTTPIALNEVLNFYGDNYKTKDAIFLSGYLKAYVAERKAYFAEDLKNNDYVSSRELSLDKKYSFEYEGVTHLF